MGRRVKNKRRGGQLESGARKPTRNNWRRSEEGGAEKRLLGGGRERGGVRQGEEVRENWSDGQDVNRRGGGGRRKEKDRGGRGGSRRGGEREKGVLTGRGDRGRGGSVAWCDRLRRLRTQRERRRSVQFWN